MLNEETPEVFMLETIFEGLDQYYYLDLGREVMKGHKLALRESEKFILVTRIKTQENEPEQVLLHTI